MKATLGLCGVALSYYLAALGGGRIACVWVGYLWCDVSIVRLGAVIGLAKVLAPTAVSDEQGVRGDMAYV